VSKLSVGTCPVLLKWHCFKGIRQTQAPIDSLPNEIVCEILTTAIETTLPLGDAHRVRKLELATVCRRWGDIIFHTPLLWTFIEVSRQWLLVMPLLKAHVERSQECPLVIEWYGFEGAWREGSFDEAMLDMVVATAYRWCCLTIIDYDDGCRPLVPDEIGCPVFPLLTHLCLSGLYWLHRPEFLYPEYVPALECLEASISAFIPDAPFLPALEELTINSFCHWTSRSLQFLSFQGLEVLSLYGYTGKEPIQPDIVHLPVLTRLSFNVSHAEQLLRILSTPSLTDVVYMQQRYETLFTAFNGIPSKWANVHDLVLRLQFKWRYNSPGEDYRVGLPALCLAAPEVRSIKVMAIDLHELLHCQQGIFPIDHWVHLEQFTIACNEFHKLSDMGKHIVPWLKQRRDTGKPALSLSFLMDGDVDKAATDPLNTMVLDDMGQYCDGVELCEGGGYLSGGCGEEREWKWCDTCYTYIQ